MEILYLGHSAFRIKTRTAVVVTDPFDSTTVGIKFPRVEADIVTISHEHEDHNAKEGIKGYRKIIDGPGEYEVSGVSILGYPTFHDDKKGKLRGKNIVYVYEAEGMRLAHLGDLGHNLSSSLLEEMGEINILFIPVGGFYTIGPKIASEIVKNIQPQITIPMHYKTKELNSEVFSKLDAVDAFLKETNLTVEKSEKLTIKPIDIIETEKIVVLSRKT